jgi:hypothetical protein
MPVFAVKIGKMYPKRPESCVEVVDATMIDRSCAIVVDAMKSAAATTANTKCKLRTRLSSTFK